MSGKIILVEGNSLALKLDRLYSKGKAAHFIVKSDNNSAVEVTQDAKAEKREQTVKLIAKGSAAIVNVRAYGPVDGDIEAACKGNDSIHPTCVPALQIEVVSKIALPDENTEAGILARLLLAESRSPAYATDYGDGEDVLKSMRMMRIVLENRLKVAKNSKALNSYVACNPATLDFRGIIFANQCGRNQQIQFEGFSGTAIEPMKAGNIQDIVDYANDGARSRFIKYRKHLEEAISIAQGLDLSTEPISTSSLLYWRTAGKGSPSKYAVKQSTIGGQDFYSLPAGYLNNPDNP